MLTNPKGASQRMERRNSCGNPHSGEAALLKEWAAKRLHEFFRTITAGGNASSQFVTAIQIRTNPT
jgi:hypothetical protein